jgi:hypothetical protein
MGMQADEKIGASLLGPYKRRLFLVNQWLRVRG